MTEAVLDASIVLAWFGRERQAKAGEALRWRQLFQDGRLSVFAPPLLLLEIMNVAGRKWGWTAVALNQLAADLEESGFELQEPELASVATWVGRGLTAYDAAYVALADTLKIPLVTADRLILETAPAIALPVGHELPEARQIPPVDE